MNSKTVPEIVREVEDNFLHGNATISEYVTFDMHDTLEKIDAYLNSKHTTGEKDSLGRDKPFFNIVTAAVNVWYRATDIDRKDIRILPDKASNTATAFIATQLLQQWMRDSRFGVFLNDWGRSLSRYGSSVVKFVEKEGTLIPQVIPWNRLLVDPISFDASPTIEKIYYTPEQLLKNKNYDQAMVESLINAKASRETLDGQKKDNLNNFIEVYEVHGELPSALLKEKPEEAPQSYWDTYQQQMHVVSFVGGKDGFSDYTLFKGPEKKHPYMITHLTQEDGRTLSIGAVEHLFESQWMVNHSQKNIKDTLDIASKLIFQTADGRFAGRNVLSAIESGDIFIHKENAPLTRLANDKPDITALQNFGTQWQNLAAEITSTPDSLRGTTLPSGTPYSLGAYLGAQANSLFETMTENKGLAIEDMMRIFVIPFLKTKMNTKEEIVAVLADFEIAELDAMFIPKEAVKRFNADVKDKLLNAPTDRPLTPEDVPQPFDKQGAEQAVREDFQGNKRFFSPDDIGEQTWKEALKDLEMEVVVQVTNETSDKQAVLTTLSTLLQTVASNPLILQDPNAKMLFGKILDETGVISPIQISNTPPQPTASPPGGAEALTALTKQ